MTSAIHFTGTGPGPITRDGCAVELYRRIPPGMEPDMVSLAVPPGSSILELGAGAGRVTHALLARGYRVTAVDNSVEMLAAIDGTETVLEDIETLDLGRTFDAVMLASCLINIAFPATRAALLSSCRLHVARTGGVLIERASPAWLRELQVGLLGEQDGVRHHVDAVRHDGPLVHATLRYEMADAVWTQSFTQAVLDDEQIEAELAMAGLALDRWLDMRKRWLLATVA